MLSPADLLWIPLAGLLYWCWTTSQAIKEIALAATRRHCAALDLQLLDHTVARDRLSLRRDADGRVRVWRSWQFEFSATGNDRYRGHAVTLGRTVVTIELQPHRMP